jgi:hypothetical protein
MIKTPWWKEGMFYFTKISGWILLPIIFSLTIGKYLDHKFNTGQMIFYISLAVGFLVSMVGLVKEAQNYIKVISSFKNINDEELNNKK